ncbi:MAG: hypothetical protein E6J60_08960, partial [Deltaproteobacteria bacterium]
MVTSARGPSASDIAHFARAARAIRAQLPALELCVSLGIMEEGQARTLGEAGVDFVNHNLNTSRRFYPAICSTHTYDDRMATVRGSSRAGLGACSGVIIGMGETHEDLIDVAGELRALAVTSLPVNFLHPIEGTPLGERPAPGAADCLRALALFRLANPRAEIRAAGGELRALAVTSLPVNFLHPIEGTPLGERPAPGAADCLRALALFRLANPRAEIRAAGGRERALGAAQGLAL